VYISTYPVKHCCHSSDFSLRWHYSEDAGHAGPLVIHWENPQLNNISVVAKVMFFHRDNFLVYIWSAQAISLRLSSNQVIRHHLRMN
jgi:hypothetical protein